VGNAAQDFIEDFLIKVIMNYLNEEWLKTVKDQIGKRITNNLSKDIAMFFGECNKRIDYEEIIRVAKPKLWDIVAPYILIETRRGFVEWYDKYILTLNPQDQI